MTARKLLFSVLLSVAAMGCHGSQAIDYAKADPVLDARRAALDSGQFHLLAIAVGDSQVVPWDTTVTKEKSYNLDARIILLQPDPHSERAGQPSEGQLRYVTRYNTTLLALVDTNAMGIPHD